MKLIFEILKWLLIILFFPLSLVLVAYYKQKQNKEQLREIEKKDYLQQGL